MKTRILTGLAILAFIIPTLLYGGWLLLALIAFIVIMGGMELLDLSEHKKQWPWYMEPIIIASVFSCIFLPEHLALATLGVWILLFLSFPVFSEAFSIKDSFLSSSYLVLFYMIGASFMNLYVANPLYIWMIIIATYACDTAAYFSGYFFGKHKLNTRISPKKTIEGSLGGWIFGSLCSFTFAFYFIPDVGLLKMAFAATILPLCGQLGDLAFSAIKRSYGIKDFSNLLPGHGGILDRIDSLIFNFICFHLLFVVMSL